jgi:hypothetical protein
MEFAQFALFVKFRQKMILYCVIVTSSIVNYNQNNNIIFIKKQEYIPKCGLLSCPRHNRGQLF